MDLHFCFLFDISAFSIFPIFITHSSCFRRFWSWLLIWCSSYSCITNTYILRQQHKLNLMHITVSYRKCFSAPVTGAGELTTATLYPYWNDEPKADMSVARARTTVSLCQGDTQQPESEQLKKHCNKNTWFNLTFKYIFEHLALIWSNAHGR